MTAIDIMKLGDVLHELSDTSDGVLNVIRVLRGIPGKDHDDTVDTLYRVYDDILAETERLAKGIRNDAEPEEAYWYVPYFDNLPSKYAVCSECHFTMDRTYTMDRMLISPTRYCPGCGRFMDFSKLFYGGTNEQKTEEKEDEAPEE